MKKLILPLLVLLLISCDSTQLKDHWKSPDIDTYDAQKVFVLAMTDNTEARRKFENKMQAQLSLRGVQSTKSLDKFDTDFISKKRTEDEIKKLEKQLAEEGYDTVIFTKVVGIKNKIKYKEDYSNLDKNHNRFNEDYLMYQDQFFNPDKYKDYQVYNAETSVYCICPTKERTLVWKGYIDIIDPDNINKTVNDYSKLLIMILEEDSIVPLRN
ncbi:hypothetical protein [Olleya sp. R77988]|uniref:hypothetical protein n=1 Tax=Olleya sp. R77988 TaxID=3093875 RepID=UPI0037C82928